ncbi:MAG: hypothetical protein U1D30_07570 [Planctomycetota bacterium]
MLVENDIRERMEIEDKILSHVQAALLVALQCPIERSTAGQWLERICFLGDSFRRHVERLFAIEEDAGYMDFIAEGQRPTLGHDADDLRNEHGILVCGLSLAVQAARNTVPVDLTDLYAVQGRFLALLEHFKRHRDKEHELWMEAYLVDIGGEG